jgi:hypothetical protein
LSSPTGDEIDAAPVGEVVHREVGDGGQGLGRLERRGEGGAGLGEEGRAALERLDAAAGRHLGADVGADGEQAGDPAVVVAQRLDHEADEGLALGAVAQRSRGRHLAGVGRLAAGVDVVEDPVDLAVLELGEGLAEAAADQRTAGEEPLVRLVGEGEDVLGPVENADR